MMGTGQSKNSPNVQMRRKMENGFDDDNNDIETLGFSDRGGGVDRTRSKSNLTFHASERFNQNEEDEYFNQIYNKRAEKSLNSLIGSSNAVKSAPAGSKKEKDPEVAAAIAELEETFKVLGDAPITQNEERTEEITENDYHEPSHLRINRGNASESANKVLSDENHYVNGSEISNHSSFVNRNNENSDRNILILEPSSNDQIPYDRNLISRAGQLINDSIEQNGFMRRISNSRHLDLSDRGTGSSSSGLSYSPQSSIGSSSTIPKSKGSDMRTFLVSSHSNMPNMKRLKTQSQLQQSILLQQRRELQHQRKQLSTTDSSNKNSVSESQSDPRENNEKDWKYEPPKINGFDIDKFKEINSKVTSTTMAPIIMRRLKQTTGTYVNVWCKGTVGDPDEGSKTFPSEEEDDKGYYSRSPDIPAYTKDELELIATLEREVY